MSSSDWHLVALAMFISPLVVTGLGTAITSGHSDLAVLAMALAMAGVLVALRNRRRRAASRTGRCASARCHECVVTPHRH